MGNLATALTLQKVGSKIATMIPGVIIGALVMLLILRPPGCNSEKKTLQAAKDTVRIHDHNDSLLKAKADSAYGVGLTLGAKLQYDALRSEQAKKNYLAMTQSNHDSITTDFLLTKMGGCDSVINAQDMELRDFQHTILIKNSIIDLQNERLMNFSKNESVLHKLLDSTKIFASPIRITTFIKYNLDVKAGSGVGSLLALQLEGSVRFGKWGIFVQPQFEYFDKPRMAIIGGATYTIYSN